jgi:hypothetical protein
MATYDAGSIVYKASIDTKGLKDDAGKVDSVVKGLSSTAKVQALLLLVLWR